jgi:hypothetical protein
MNKKILFVGIGVIMFGLLVVGGLLFFYSPEGTISENIRDVLPFGNGRGDINSPADSDTPEEIIPTESNKDLPSFFRLSEVPVSGAVGFLKNNSTYIRYTDRATGHIYDINPRTLEKVKIANITQPKIYEAFFKADGSGVIYRSLEDDGDEIINTSIDLTPPKGTSTEALYTETPTILRGDIRNIAVSNSGKIAFVSHDDRGVFLSQFNGVSPQKLFASNFTNWLIYWTTNSIILTTKPSTYTYGFSYKLNPSTGLLSKIAGPLYGLNLLINQSENKAVFSYLDGSLIRTIYKDLQTDFQSELPSTFAEKCIWSHKQTSVVYCASPAGGVSAGEPDLWYQGKSHYLDQIWVINPETTLDEILIDPKKDFNVDIDVVDPFLTPDEDYLIFTNKNDLSLWALKLSE